VGAEAVVRVGEELMAWSAAFLSELTKRSLRMIFVLRPIADPVGTWGFDPTTGWPYQAAWELSTAPLKGLKSAVPCIAAVHVDGCDLQPRSWSTSIGAFSVTIAGLDVVGALVGKVTRGTFVELVAGFAGWDVSQYEPVAIGQIRNITLTGQMARIDCRDILAAIQSRPTTSGDQAALFWNTLGGATRQSTTIITANYTAGAATINITSSTGFARQDDGGGALKGALKITPNAGSDFYLTFTGKTATTFTGLSATGQFGTTAATANIGNAVKECVYVDDHPIDLFRRIWASTGTAARNGAYDWLPADWGCGYIDRLLDHDDMDSYKTASTPASGSSDWDLLPTATQSDGLSYLLGVLAAGGFYPTMRQGRITVRCGHDPHGGVIAAVTRITDDDIVDGSTTSMLWDDQLSAEYNSITVGTSAATATSTEPVGSLPADNTVTYDAAAYTWSNSAGWNSEMLARLKPWAVRIPERHTMTLRGLQWGRLAVGDIVEITSSRLRGRLKSTSGGMVRRIAEVTQVSPGWMSEHASTRIAVHALPDTSEMAY
jgi:hypothetical protein